MPVGLGSQHVARTLPGGSQHFQVCTDCHKSALFTACPVNFEFQNYTIITSRCKGPQYPPNLCCSALKDFACPFADEINDLTNDCASTMFSYINLYGKYPPGLFASECRDGKFGLECPAPAPGESEKATTNKNSGSQMICSLFPVLMLTAASLLLLQFM
ncbi:UNVERIFIED_CONTAM: GPI-anchored protein LLG1 [Sesamum latifolium]|uniref:GPI-anchored protein LLG1 n=1 Tax=Sesamum latifolium TaxID=2727402 RepID=A0AAW2WP64_9LAMI